MVTFAVDSSVLERDELKSADSQCIRETQDWLRHSLTIERLWRPAAENATFRARGVSCGPMAFAAAAKLDWESALDFFPCLSEKPWINRTEMERALRAIGYDFARTAKAWPLAGLCLLQFTGPWMRHGYPAALLQHTHWIAVSGEYVFDINWNGWLPRENWEEVVIEELLSCKSTADGWEVLTSYEIENSPNLFDLAFFCAGAAHAAGGSNNR